VVTASNTQWRANCVKKIYYFYQTLLQCDSWLFQTATGFACGTLPAMLKQPTMKIFLSIILFGLRSQTIGQTIPNAGFENWAWIGGWYENPQYWTTNNFQISAPVVKDSVTPYQGSYAIKVNRTGISGYAKTKFAFSQHPANIKIFVKSNILSGDSTNIRVLAYSAGSIVDSGRWTNTTSIIFWTQQTIPIAEVRPFLGLFNKIDIVDTNTIDKNIWVRVDKEGDIKIP